MNPNHHKRRRTDLLQRRGGQKSAPPIVFHHGWPLSFDDWETQMLFFVAKGCHRP
jgi:non-heme chloroperoxidase